MCPITRITYYCLSPDGSARKARTGHRPLVALESWRMARGFCRGANPAAPTPHRVPRGAWPPARWGASRKASRSSMIESGARRVRWDWRRARCVGRSLPSGESTTACRQHAVGVVAGAPPAALGRAAAPRTAPGGAPLSPPLPSVATALDSRCQVCSRSGAESSRRWVPGTLRTSCELLILVNQPAKPVAWSDVADLGCGAEPRAA